jgi:hypothetical protein
MVKKNTKLRIRLENSKESAIAEQERRIRKLEMEVKDLKELLAVK